MLVKHILAQAGAHPHGGREGPFCDSGVGRLRLVKGPRLDRPLERRHGQGDVAPLLLTAGVARRWASVMTLRRRTPSLRRLAPGIYEARPRTACELDLGVERRRDLEIEAGSGRPARLRPAQRSLLP